MSRLLWLGLLACVAVLCGAIVLIGLHEAPRDDVHRETHVAERAPIGELDLADAEAATVRTTAASDAGAVEHPTLDGLGDLEADLSWEDVPQFPGVVEVRVVRAEDGTPIAGAEVTLGPDFLPGDDGDAPLQARSDLRLVNADRAAFTTDADGRVVLSNAFGPRAQVLARTADRPPVGGLAELTRESPRAFLELRLHVERNVLVRVLDPSGSPFRPSDWGLGEPEARFGLVIAGSCRSPGRTVDRADALVHSSRRESDSTWRVRIRGVDEACAEALVDDIVVGTAPVGASAQEVVLRLDRAAHDALRVHLDLLVLDDRNGAPIEGALVGVEGATTQPERVRTDGEGRARAEFLRTRTTAALVSARGFVSARVAIEAPGRSVVRLVPGRRISGVVVDERGAPLAWARVEVRDAAKLGIQMPSLRTKSDGRFALEDVPALELELRISYRPPGLRLTLLTQTVDCRSGDVRDLVVQFTLGDPAAAGR